VNEIGRDIVFELVHSQLQGREIKGKISGLVYEFKE